MTGTKSFAGSSQEGSLPEKDKDLSEARQEVPWYLFQWEAIRGSVWGINGGKKGAL